MSNILKEKSVTIGMIMSIIIIIGGVQKSSKSANEIIHIPAKRARVIISSDLILDYENTLVSLFLFSND